MMLLSKFYVPCPSVKGKRIKNMKVKVASVIKEYEQGRRPCAMCIIV